MPEDADDVPLGRVRGLQMRLNTPKGRGVFATHPILRGTLIEVCPVLVLSASDSQLASRTLLDSYTYNWPQLSPRRGPRDRAAVAPAPATSASPPRSPSRPTQALILGLGSMFNHARGHGENVGWVRDAVAQVVRYTALRDIAPGEELCISYGAKTWFDDVDDAGSAESPVVGGAENRTREEEESVETALARIGVGLGPCEDEEGDAVE